MFYFPTPQTTAVKRWNVIRVLCGRYFGDGIVSVGYAIAHPRLNPVGILPPGSRPSDVAAVCIIDIVNTPTTMLLR